MVIFPKRAKSTRKDFQKNTDEKSSSNDLKGKGSKPATEVDALWTCKTTEVVVAVIRDAEQKQNYTLRHSEFQSLRPDELIIGEVTFEDYDGAIGFVNIRNAHWKFVYLYALSNHIFVVDPLQGSNEVEDSKQAGHRFGQYFKMRRNRFGKEDWVDIKWQPGTISHTFQKDGTSCGIFVMQMAKMTGFPNMPQIFHIDPKKKSLQKLRRDMAEEILKGSVSSDEFYSFCGNKDLPIDAVWIQCGTCTRWFPTHCLGMIAAQIPSKDTPWFCVLCN